MQITIDTKKDSPEEIKKAIHLLSVLVQGRAGHSTNIFDNNTDTPPSPGPTSPDPTSGSAFSNMFGSDAQSELSPEKQEEKKEIPRVLEY